MRRPPAVIWLLVPLMLCLVQLEPAQATPGCPNTLVRVGGYPAGAINITTTAAELDTTQAGPYGGGGSASYDLSTGRFDVGSSSAGVGRIIALDSYTVDHLPPGSTFNLTARLEVHAEVDASYGFQRWAWYEGRLRYGTAVSSVEAYVSAMRPPPHLRYLNTAIELTIPVNVGVPFDLETRLWCECEFGGRSVSSSPARLTFVGLPTGGRITSCQGFVQESPVAVLPATWSHIKASGVTD